MTDQPYTAADLLAEAARQHTTATEDPDFSGIGEQMEGHKIPSRDDFQWDQLDEDDYDKAMRAIDDLLGNAEHLADAFPEYAAAIALVKKGQPGIEQLRAIADPT